MQPNQFTLGELFRFVTATSILVACSGYWRIGGVVIGLIFAAAVISWPRHEDSDWSVRYFICNALVVVGGMLAGIATLTALVFKD